MRTRGAKTNILLHYIIIPYIAESSCIFTHILRVHLKCEAHEGRENVTRKFEELSWYKIPLGNSVIC